MAFQEVRSLDTDLTISLGGFNKKTGKKNPVSIEGYYLGSKKVDNKKAKNGYAYLHVLQTATGNLGVWGKTDLDRKLLSVPPGTMIRATHSGMQATPNGEMYKYKVEIDKDNTTDVTGLQSESSSQEDEGSGFTSDGEDTESTDLYSAESDDQSYSAPAVNVAASAKERAAKVQAMLANRKKN